MYTFADRMLENIDDLVQGWRGWTKSDHSQYYPVACPHSSEVLALKNGSLMSVIRMNGYMGQYFPDAFKQLKASWTAFLRNATNDKTASGFDMFWSYEYDPEGMQDNALKYRQQMIDAAERRGMKVRDILEEEAKVYGSICARETQLLIIVTHISSLTKSSQNDVLPKARAEAMKAPRGADAMAMQVGVKALEAIHQQHVNKVSTFLESAGRGYTFERLDCYESLRVMRTSLVPGTTGEGWKPRLTMNDCKFRATEGVPLRNKAAQGTKKPNDWTFMLPPKLKDQMLPGGVVDLGEYVVIGERTYAPMYVKELANDPAPLEELLRTCHSRRLPLRLVYSLMTNSEQANYWNRLFAGIFTFASASNRQISKADKAMKEYKENNGAVLGYGISAVTWAPTEVTYRADGSAQYGVKTLQKRAGDLETLLQSWGSQQIDNVFGCAVESVMGATPGYSMPPNCPKAPQIEMDVVAQLPLMRPASIWAPDNAIWFRTQEGVLSPYQPMSSRQSSMLQLVMGGMGFGKSNMISENIFYFANHPSASQTPYIRGIDFGASAAGVIDMVRESLPANRKHEAVFENFSASGSMVKNLLDCPLGCRYPLTFHETFLTSFLVIICNDLLEKAGMNNLVAVLKAAIRRAYEIRDPDSQLFESVSYNAATAHPVVREALESIEFECDEMTHYWEVVEALAEYGIKNNDRNITYAAKVAQRYCTPLFSDLVMACDQLREQFKSMPDVGGKNLVEAVVNSLLNANSEFPVFSGITNTDISESRICVFDMSETFGRGTSPYDNWRRSVYFAVVYRLLTEDLFVNRELSGAELENNQERLGLSDSMLAFHLSYLESQDQLIKMFWADELHRLGSVQGALDILDSIAMEGRKYRIGLMLGTQMAVHFPPKVLDLCTSAFIFGVNQSAKIATGLQGIFDLTGDEVKTLTNITKPNADKGAEVFVIHRVDSGEQRMKLHFQLGAIKLWAYATEGNERALRSILYAEGSSTGWARRTLAANVRSVEQKIKKRQSEAGQISEQEAIRQIADQLLATDITS